MGFIKKLFASKADTKSSVYGKKFKPAKPIDWAAENKRYEDENPQGFSPEAKKATMERVLALDAKRRAEREKARAEKEAAQGSSNLKLENSSTELKNYILSRLREMVEPTPPASQPSKKPRKLSTNQKLAQAEKQARDERNKRFRDAMGQISAGIGAPTGVRAGGWDRQNASTDLRTQLAYVLADKLEELKQSTVDSAAAKRVAQVRSKSFRGEEKPVFKGGTGGTNKPEQIGTRSGAGKGVIGKRLSTLYKGKTSKGVAKREESTSLQDRIVGMLLEKKKVNPWAVCHASTGPEKSDKFERCVMDVKEKHGIKEGTLADRLINILAEAFLGTSRDYVARAMSREDKGSSMKDRSKKGKALASVINKQPKVIKAKAEKKAADDAQEKANRAKGGNSNLRSSDSATHWRNNWPSGSWGSA